MTHYAAHIGSTSDVGITEAVYYSAVAIKQTYKTAGISGAAHTARQDANVVYAGVTSGFTADGTGIALMTAYVYAGEGQVAHRAVIDAGKQRLTQTADGVVVAF